MPGPKGGQEREEQVREIMELRRALARTRQDLLRTRGRGAPSSSDEEPCRREELSGSLSGSLNGLSNKPCLNRELVAKLRSMTETIKMLSTENVSLREENDGLLELHGSTADADNNDVTDGKLKAVIQSYEVQVREMADKVASLEVGLAEARDKPVGGQERDKYKSLARRLKEERNQYKDLVEDKQTEQAALQDEMEKMTDMIGELRENCGVLQEELLRARQEDVPRRDAGVQCGPVPTGGPPVRRASLTELSPRARLIPKRTISNISQSSLSSSSSQSPRGSQLQRSIELSRPKQRTPTSSSPSSPAKGARIAKPVSRQPSAPSSPQLATYTHQTTPSRVPVTPSRLPFPTSGSRPGSGRSRLPLPTGQSSPRAGQERREVLHITEPEETRAQTEVKELEQEEDAMCQSDSSSLLAEAEAVTRIVTVQLERVMSRETSPTMDTGEREEEGPPGEREQDQLEEDDQFPAPPSLGDLEKLAMEQDSVPSTPRTLRRADNLRQKMAARRIQRTWKHFYQELEEKKVDTGKSSEQLVEEEQDKDEAISSIQAVMMGHQVRAASLAAARARGGIFTARPWVGGALSEGEESEEEVEKLQGIIRSHSFRLRTLHEEDIMGHVGKVSSIRAKFSRRSPDGASDDCLADTDRNV